MSIYRKDIIIAGNNFTLIHSERDIEAVNNIYGRYVYESDWSNGKETCTVKQGDFLDNEGDLEIFQVVESGGTWGHLQAGINTEYTYDPKEYIPFIEKFSKYQPFPEEKFKSFGIVFPFKITPDNLSNFFQGKLKNVSCREKTDLAFWYKAQIEQDIKLGAPFKKYVDSITE